MKNLYTKLSVIACFSLFATISGFAQGQFNCGYVEARSKLLQAHPEIAQQEERADKLTLRQLAENRFKDRVDTAYLDTLVIPMVFHLVHKYGNEEISNRQIQRQVEILNRDFNFKNADSVLVYPEFRAVTKAAAIKFALATIDPNGNCTNGITRNVSLETTSGDDGAKIISWDRSKYLNVWVCGDIPGNTAGYAYKPGSVDDPFNKVDGILIEHVMIGDSGTANPGTSRALTHEVGHWINLDHTWGGTNNPEVACGDDGVSDTPMTKGHGDCGTPKDAVCDTAGIQLFTFNNVTTTSGRIDTTVYEFNRGAEITHWTASSSLSANSTEDGLFSFTNWPTGAANGTLEFDTNQTLDLTKYYEITMTPKFGNKLTITGLKLKMRRNASGIRALTVRVSSDNFSKNVPIRKQSPSTVVDSVQGNYIFIKTDTVGFLELPTIKFTGSQAITQRQSAITFRIYGLFSEDASGTFALDTLQFEGGGPALIENVNNYMEYSYCPSVMFTAGQVERMRASLQSPIAQRSNLTTAENRAATGTNGIDEMHCPPLADFYNDTIACTNTFVRFKDYSGRAFINSFAWTFQDGTPSTSTAENPSVKFSTPGWKIVTLTVTGDYGSNTITKNKAIYISDASVAETVPYTETFTNSDVLGDKWLICNFENNQTLWSVANDAGYYDTKCARLNASRSTGGKSLIDGMGDMDFLYSPAFNLASTDNTWRVAFKLSGATRTAVSANMNDSLFVEYSTDCGGKWSVLKTLVKTELHPAGYVLPEFKPTTKLQWKQFDIPINSAIAKDNIRFRFYYKSATSSNNIFVDDFFIGPAQRVNIDEIALDQSNFIVAPNPITRESVLKFYLAGEADVNLSLTDITGKVVGTAPQGVLSEGEQSIGLNPLTGNLTHGIYMLMVKVGTQVVTHKLLVD